MYQMKARRGNEARCTAPDEGGGTRLGVLYQMKVGEQG